jgi:hypothetical protein
MGGGGREVSCLLSPRVASNGWVVGWIGANWPGFPLNAAAPLENPDTQTQLQDSSKLEAEHRRSTSVRSAHTARLSLRPAQLSHHSSLVWVVS